MPAKPKKPTDKERLQHMLNAIDKIFRYTENINFEEYSKNEMLQDAVMKNFEVIGEASTHLSDELKNRYNNIEWRAVEGFRHVLVHDYYKINIKRIWSTKTNFLSPLQEKLKDLIDTEFDKS